MSRVLNEAETVLAGQLFSLADMVAAAARLVAAKKQAFTMSQSELRAAEGGLQKAQEELSAFIKQRLVDGNG